MCKNCYSEPQYEGNMVNRYLKCVNCGERWPTGVVVSVMNADCCRTPNIHVFKEDETMLTDCGHDPDKNGLRLADGSGRCGPCYYEAKQRASLPEPQPPPDSGSPEEPQGR